MKRKHLILLALVAIVLGAIYLLHAVSETNAQILGQVIDDLRGEGYVFCAYR